MRILPISFKINTLKNTNTNKTTPFPNPALNQDSVSFSGVRQAGQKQKETVQALGKDLKQNSIKEISTIKNKVKHVHEKSRLIQKEGAEALTKSIKVQVTANREFELASKLLADAQENNWKEREAKNGKLSREFIFLRDSEDDLMGSCIMSNSKGENIRIIRFKTIDGKITPYKIITNKNNSAARYSYNRQGALKNSSVVTYGEKPFQEDYDFSKEKLVGYSIQRKTDGKETPTENLYYFDNDGNLTAADKGFLQTEDDEVWIEEEFNFSKNGLTSYFELYTKSVEENTKTYKKFIDFQKAKDSYTYESNVTEDSKGNKLTGKKLIVKAGQAQDYFVNLVTENNKQTACARRVELHNGKIHTIALNENNLGKDAKEAEKLFKFKNGKLTNYAKNAKTVAGLLVESDREINF